MKLVGSSYLPDFDKGGYASVQTVDKSVLLGLSFHNTTPTACGGYYELIMFLLMLDNFLQFNHRIFMWDGILCIQASKL